MAISLNAAPLLFNSALARWQNGQVALVAEISMLASGCLK